MIPGPLVQEVQQVFGDWLSQVMRVYVEENIAEIEWVVGPIPIGRYRSHHTEISFLYFSFKKAEYNAK
jgi:hypothetical protein